MSELRNINNLESSKIPYAHLHLHTEYSLLDGANKIDELAKKIKELGMNSVAMSDHGNMFGALEFYKAMKKVGVKPIIGLEAYLHNKQELDNKDRGVPRFHLCLFAKNEIGYKNLMYLTSQSYIHGMYGKPRINKKILRERSEGLICSSACLAGEISWQLNLNPRMDSKRLEKKKLMGARGYNAALEAALEYRDIFGEDFYIEIMRHGLDDQMYIDNALIDISIKTGIKLIATNDAHYNKREDADMQDAVMMISTGKMLTDENRLKHTLSEFYIKSPKEMLELFRDIPEAVFNTQEIADKCNLEIELKNDKNPPTPPSFIFAKEYAKNEGLDIDSEVEYFIYKCKKGLDKKLKSIESNKHQEYRDRLDYEIKIISQMGFAGYMLIVWDYINFAKQNAIPVGPGRGSAAGSLVSYCLGITDIDPIKYDLLFERFLNPERISMPDIDTDFCQLRRDEVMEYMREKYGKYNVAQVITFHKMLARGAIRDAARIYGMDMEETNHFANLIPHKLGIKLTGYTDKNGNYVEGAYELEPKIKKLIESSPLAKKVWDVAIRLENLNRHASKHAGALVVDSKQELWNKIPLYVYRKSVKKKSGDDTFDELQNVNEELIVTQYPMDYLEAVDLVKFDFLGLRTLSVIQNTLNIIKETDNINLDLSSVDINDDKVYQTLRSGNTLGIFQLESSGMQEVIRKLQPTGINDLSPLLALYRPGPMGSGMTDSFINRKHGREKITYIFDELEPILKNTYGTIVYQEQVLQIVQVIAGYSLGEADLMRKAMGKKDAKIMQENKDKFANGAKNRGYNESEAIKLFDDIAKFAEYGFNKAHSVAYGFLTFQTTYLKTYFKHEFMAALLTSKSNKIEEVAKYIDEVKAMGIDVLPPHVNTSRINFSVITEKGNVKKIVFGLNALKSAGINALESIIENRLKDGEYKDLSDFISRVDFSKLTKRAFEPLIKSGSLDNLGFNRASMLEAIDNICDMGRLASKMQATNTMGLFGEESIRVSLKIKRIQELPKKQLLQYEYDSMGIYVSGHPLDDYKDMINSIKNVVKIDDLKTLEDKSQALIIGILQKIEPKTSKKTNRTYYTAKIIDFTGLQNLMFFESHQEILNEMDITKPVGLIGRVNKVVEVETFNQNEKEDDGDTDKVDNAVRYKIDFKINEIITLEECKNAKVRVKRDKTFGKERELYKQDSMQFYDDGFNSGFNSYERESDIEPLDIIGEQSVSDSCICIVFDSMIEQSDIDKIATLAKNHKGRNRFAIAFKHTESKNAYFMESDINVSQELHQKLAENFPHATLQLL